MKRAAVRVVVLAALAAAAVVGWRIHLRETAAGEHPARADGQSGAVGSLGGSASASATPVRTIPYRVTSRTYDLARGESVATSPAILAEIDRALALWASVPEVGLRFEYAGLVADAPTSLDHLPDDGAITIVLDSEHDFGNELEAGQGGYRGTIPDDYQKGAVFMNTRANRAALSLSPLVHELGHALGILDHTPSVGSIMSCGSKGWAGDYLFFSDQDRANLVHAWNPATAYAIAGRAAGVAPRGYAYAVEINSGRTFSVVTKADGSFAIPVGVAGRYRLLVKGDDSDPGNHPGQLVQAPSWYLAPGRATADPYGGEVFELSPSHRQVSDLEVGLVEARVPFNLFWSRTFTGDDQPPGAYVPSFLRPGHEVRFNLIYNGALLTELVPYGAHPDVTITDLTQVTSNGTTMATVRALPGAQPGHRLILARSPAGDKSAGLVGVHVIAEALPSRLSTPAVELANPSDVSALDPDFWRAPREKR